MTGRKEKLAEFHRANIVEAAKELFREKGVEKVTMDQLAKEAEYSKATIYVYFKSKEEIVGAITLESMKYFKEIVSEALQGEKDFFEKYRAICTAMVSFYENSPEQFQVFNSKIALDDPQLPRVYREIYTVGEEVNQLIIEFLNQGAKRGLVRKNSTDLQTVFFIWFSLTGIISMAYEKEEYLMRIIGCTKEKFLKDSFDTLLSTVLNSSVRVR